MIKQNLDPDNYYTQKNNTISPCSACMPTSRVMFYLGNGIEIPNSSGLAHDDYLMSILKTSEAWEFMSSRYPWATSQKFPPWEIHGMYNNYLDIKLFGKKTAEFNTDLTFDDIFQLMDDGEIVMTSGSFPEAGIDGHAFCFTGYAQNCLLIADPYGDFHTNYISGSGYGVTMSKKEFKEHVKPAVTKWGHVLII
jgi:hypothetical protein